MKLFSFLMLSIFVSAVASEASAAKPKKFGEATRVPFSQPPEKSRNGKAIADMKKKVEDLWDKIVFEKDGKKIQHVVTFATDVGDFKVEVWPDVAPNHARSFLALSQAGFYDGLIFHRVIPGFMIQGGCPIGNGTGGPGYCVKQEFNDKSHERGVLSMARSKDVDSGGSQFFVCVAPAKFLDNKYTGFGKVLEGMDVVDKIVGADRNGQDRPLEPVTIKSVKVTLKGQDK